MSRRSRDTLISEPHRCSPWLSASGEVVTYLAVLAFYITKHRIFELMETVAIAVLCSIHLIRSRNKHLDHEHALQEELTALKHSVRSARVLPDLEGGGPHDASTAPKHASTESTIVPPPPYSLAPAKARRRWRRDARRRRRALRRVVWTTTFKVREHARGPDRVLKRRQLLLQRVLVIEVFIAGAD